MPSEDSILARIAQYFPLDGIGGHAAGAPQPHGTAGSLRLGRGDDCAVVRGGGDICVSTDMFLEGTHFCRRYFTPEEIGHKALAVNISDIAAMGAEPVGCTLCVGLPLKQMASGGIAPKAESGVVDESWLERFFAGMSAVARRYGVSLAGGDLSAASSVQISITIWGRVAPGARGFLRRGVLGRGLDFASRPVQAGDVVFCVGALGLARVGLGALEASGRANAQRTYPQATQTHLAPEPQVAAGMALACCGADMALMDISDGVARDVPRLLGQAPLGVDSTLTADELHPEVRRYAAAQGIDPLTVALLGGEDYALLGVCAPESLPAVQEAVPTLLPLGRVSASAGLRCGGRAFVQRGFDHFG